MYHHWSLLVSIQAFNAGVLTFIFQIRTHSRYLARQRLRARQPDPPFVLAQAGGSGERIRDLLRKFGGVSPTQLMMTPLVRELLK
jgi:hypothetical protein